jgi:CHAT domain-containing protein
MTLAFVITRDNVHVAKLRVTEAELALAVATFLDFSGDSGTPPSLKQLHRWLIAPIGSQLRTSMIAIVPHGVLHNLPFAALTPDGKQYLGDRHEIFYLPSVSALPYIRARTKPGGDRMLVLANDTEVGLPYLGHAYDEARAVASFFGTEPRLGNAATASVLRADAGNYDILHLIAHIERDDQTSQFTRIMLAPGEGDDGPLELHQVYGLDLRRTNLVVLSGCQSELGRQSRGDDIVGLSRAFIYAGAPSVVASLWNVDDEATQQFMIAFYDHLKHGMSKAEALGAAQADTRRKYPNPYYWAGFVLTGDPGVTENGGLVASSGSARGGEDFVRSGRLTSSHP